MNENKKGIEKKINENKEVIEKKIKGM